MLAGISCLTWRISSPEKRSSCRSSSLTTASVTLECLRTLISLLAGIAALIQLGSLLLHPNLRLSLDRLWYINYTFVALIIVLICCVISVCTSRKSSLDHRQRNTMFKLIQEVIFFGSIVHLVPNVLSKLISVYAFASFLNFESILYYIIRNISLGPSKFWKINFYTKIL